jgi:hypothetical protein
VDVVVAVGADEQSAAVVESGDGALDDRAMATEPGAELGLAASDHPFTPRFPTNRRAGGTCRGQLLSGFGRRSRPAAAAENPSQADHAEDLLAIDHGQVTESVVEHYLCGLVEIHVR